MQSGLSVNNVQIGFRAQVSSQFIKEAHKYIKSHYKENKGILVDFDEKVTEYANFGYDQYIIKHIYKIIDGKHCHRLVALLPGMTDTANGIVLTSKDHFRKLIEKFININEYEFTRKMADKNKRFYLRNNI